MLPQPLRAQLLDCMDRCFNYASLQEFTVINKEIFGRDYDSVVPNGNSFDKGMDLYISRLEKINTVFYFIKIFCDNYAAQSFVNDLYEEFLKVYEPPGNGPVRIRGELLDCILVDNNSLPFIGRSNVKEAVYKMLNKERVRVTLLRGSPRSGLSYVHRYLNEVAGKTSRYKAVNINLVDIQNEYAGGKKNLLYASHIAAYIADYFALETKVNEESKELFKITPFIGQLRKFLQNNQQTYLFFIDQFSGPALADDVPKLILGIAQLSFETNIECYTFLSGARDNELQNWPIDLQRIIRKSDNCINLDYFDKTQLELFFKKIYLYLSTVYKVEYSLAEFIDQINTHVITSDYYTNPNVETIGAQVSSWYDRFCHENFPS